MVAPARSAVGKNGQMAAEHAIEHANVAAEPQRCLAVATDFERYPDWARDIKEAHILERDEAGRGTKVAYRAAAMGRSASYVLAYTYVGEQQISWRLEQGDIMKALDGSYVFAAGASGTTDITYELSVELVVPIPGFVKRRAETKIMGTALRELKHRVESLTV